MSSCILDIWREGGHWRQSFAKGEPKAPIERIEDSPRFGTRVKFKPDLEIFAEVTEFVRDTVEKRLRQMAFLNSGLRITFQDERSDPAPTEYYFEDGLLAYVKFLNEGKTVLHEPVHFKGEVDRIQLRVRDAVDRLVLQGLRGAHEQHAPDERRHARHGASRGARAR